MDPQLKARIERDFTYHAPSPYQVNVMQGLREEAKRLALQIAECVTEPRERALALTHLEQAVMAANAGIVRPPLTTPDTAREREAAHPSGAAAVVGLDLSALREAQKE